jgi:UDP-N-acetylmuramoyl-L-alanyl-D-glutamate--2,6-diaminopimelate ligase
MVSILVDYAHEPKSLESLFLTIEKWKKKEIFNYVIHLLSCDGVGRDDWKKPILGEISWKYSDYNIITTDNYGEKDNPYEIIKLITQSYDRKKLNSKYHEQIIRRVAMKDALNITKKTELTNQKFLIVSTGVGSEQSLFQPHGKMNWDEREIWREIYKESVDKS